MGDGGDTLDGMGRSDGDAGDGDDVKCGERAAG